MRSTLEAEKGAQDQGIQEIPEAEKVQDSDSPPEPPCRTSLADKCVAQEVPFQTPVSKMVTQYISCFKSPLLQ